MEISDLIIIPKQGLCMDIGIPSREPLFIVRKYDLVCDKQPCERDIDAQ